MKKTKANEPSQSLDILMLGYLCIKEVKNLREAVGILDRFGLPDSIIAKITGRKERAIRDARYESSKNN